jgi:raffinose/stachyose/melibiose transport system permease protein
MAGWKLLVRARIRLREVSVSCAVPGAEPMKTSPRTYNFRKNPKAIAALILPAFILYVVFEVLPILQSFYFSFFQWNGMVKSPLKYVGLRNYVDLWRNEYFPRALGNTLWFMILSPIVQLAIAFLLAYLLSAAFRGYKVFKTIFFIPQVLTLTGVSIMWFFILFPETGPLSSFLTAIGLGSWTRNWLVDPQTAITTVILVNSWIAIGFYMVLFISAIASISEEVLDAADLDGSFGLHRIFNIILPMIWSVVMVAFVIQITGNLKMFEFVYVMTRGGPDGLTNTLGTLLYNESFEYQHFGIGSAISVVIFTFSIMITVLTLRIMRRDTI